MQTWCFLKFTLFFILLPSTQLGKGKKSFPVSALELKAVRMQITGHDPYGSQVPAAVGLFSPHEVVLCFPTYQSPFSSGSQGHMQNLSEQSETVLNPSLGKSCKKKKNKIKSFTSLKVIERSVWVDNVLFCFALPLWTTKRALLSLWTSLCS